MNREFVDTLILRTACDLAQRSKEGLVTGEVLYEAILAAGFDIGPHFVGGRLRSLLSRGLLEKDEYNSTCRASVYRFTDAGSTVSGRTFDGDSHAILQ